MIRFRFLILVFLFTLIAAGTSIAQVGGGAGGGAAGGAGGAGGLGGAGGIGGGAGANNGNSAGIKIDSEGIMNLVVTSDQASALDKNKREALAKKNLSPDLSRRSAIRCVSLVQLEKQLETLLATRSPIPIELFYLAGLQRLDYVFVFPDESDLVIAGPADGFIPDGVGRMVGVGTGRPTLRLDDLFVAIRTVARSRQLGCSIDPVPRRLAELQKFIQQGGPAGIDVVEARFNQMDDILGLQDVRIDGVPPDSHFATMLVEADYRMKRIAIGLENPRIKGLRSHLASTGPGSNTMQRWWFVPAYDGIYRSEAGDAFRFSGQRAKLLTEEEVADVNGNRSSSATINKSAQAFAKLFTEKFPQLADSSPVFAELQNLIDLSLFAALLKHEGLAEKIGWKQALLLDESRLKHPVFDVPKKVPSQVNYRRAGNMVIGQVCGGVVVLPQRSYEIAVSQSQDSALGQTRSKVPDSPRFDSHRWWWDLEK